MGGLVIQEQKKFHPLRWIFGIAILALLIVAGWYTYRWYMTGQEPPLPIPVVSANPAIDESDISQEQVDEYTVPAGQPRYITIPKIGVVKTRILSVGVTSTGELDVPKNIGDTAWYNKSALPGQGYGAVLIDGHNGGITRDGVFARLGTLEKGDEITIERGDGKQFIYKVVENESMALEDVNKTGMVKMTKSADESKEGLNLITCDGKWVPRLKQFDRRIMLRAVIAK